MPSNYITPRFAELLQKGQQSQSREQMTHTQSSTQDGSSLMDRLSVLEKRLDERSMIYHSLKSGVTAPAKAWSGELQPYKVTEDGTIEPNEAYYEAGMETAGWGMTGGIPGGATGKGSVGLTTGIPIFRGTKTFDPKVISRRLENPGEELGMHVSVSRNTAEHPSFVGRSYDGTIIEMKSNVSSPYWVEDTGTNWNPWRTVETLLNRVGNYLDNIENKGKLSMEAKKKLRNIQYKYDFAKKSFDDPEGILDSVAKPNMTQIEYVDALDTKYNKQIQKVLKDEGYDHISYINTREGNPVESAILFDKGSFSILNTSEVANREILQSLEPKQLEYPPNEIKI